MTLKYLIKFNNVKKKFNNKWIINNFNYTFYQGYVYLLKGENGSGKSTIIKLALGLYFPTQGKIERHYNNYRYVPELLPIKSEIKVVTYLAYICKLMGLKRDHELERVLEVELNKQLKSLSKGNTKKILLYLAFIGNPEVIFLDEPLDGLDKAMQQTVINYMLAKTDICYIISSHNEKVYDDFTNKKVINLG